jgi:hypothetical protein
MNYFVVGVVALVAGFVLGLAAMEYLNALLINRVMM